MKKYLPFGIALPALAALALGVPGANAETKAKQPAAAADAKAKPAAVTADAKAKQPAAPAKAKEKQVAAAGDAKAKAKKPASAEGKAKQAAAPAEAKPKQAVAPVEAKPKQPAAPAEAKSKQPAAAIYSLSEKSNLRESPSRKSYSSVWLGKGVGVESYSEKGSFVRGDWRHVIVKEGQEHAGSHGWVRRSWLDYKGKGK